MHCRRTERGRSCSNGYILTGLEFRRFDNTLCLSSTEMEGPLSSISTQFTGLSSRSYFENPGFKQGGWEGDVKLGPWESIYHDLSDLRRSDQSIRSITHLYLTQITSEQPSLIHVCNEDFVHLSFLLVCSHVSRCY
jgi:hypothetical protein